MIMEETEKTEEKASFTDKIRKINPVTLLEVLNQEEADTSAAIICSLEPAKAALILQNLDKEQMKAVATKITEGKKIRADLLDVIKKDILEKVEELERKNYVSLGGADFMSTLLNLMDGKSEKEIIKNLEEKSPELAQAVKSRRFVFEDMVLLDDRAVQKVLREIDSPLLAMALKETDDEVKDKFFRNMSKRAAEMLKEDMEHRGPVRLKDVDEAKCIILGVVRRLEECGEIVICRPSDLNFI